MNVYRLRYHELEGGGKEVRTLFGEKVHFSKDALAPEKGDRAKKKCICKAWREVGKGWGGGGGGGNQWYYI